MIGKPLTEEESAFIRDYTYPLFALREAFKERFGWLPCNETLCRHKIHKIRTRPPGESKYAPGDVIQSERKRVAVRREWIKGQVKRDEFFKEHS